MLDLIQHYDALQRFAAGVVTKTPLDLDTDLFGEYQVRLGTITRYEYDF